MLKEKPYKRPMILSHQPIRFETAQSWNPGKGNLNHSGTGNNGINWSESNPNSTPGGAGTSGNGSGNSNANGNANGNGSQSGVVFGNQ